MTKIEQEKVIDMLEEANGKLTKLKTRVSDGTISADFICSVIMSIQGDLDGHIQTVELNEVGLE